MTETISLDVLLSDEVCRLLDSCGGDEDPGGVLLAGRTDPAAGTVIRQQPVLRLYAEAFFQQ